MGVRLLEGTESIFGGAGGTICPVLRKWLAQSQIDVIDPELGSGTSFTHRAFFVGK
jgi:hypothetical protein